MSELGSQTVADRSARDLPSGGRLPDDHPSGDHPLRAAEWSALREGSRAKLRRRLAGDLDVITLKALRKEPQRRYASVEQLAEDIRRHLEGLPVQAAPDSLGYRAQKFAQRHTVGVAATFLILIAIAGGVVATIREARIASVNERRAEERFNDVRKLAGSLMFEIHDSIESLPGSTPARKLIVERALEYLDSLARESRGDPSLQRELADAYKRIGDVQGGPFAANLGDIGGALRSYENAISIWQMLLASSATNVDDRIGLAEAFRLKAATLSVSGKTAGALENTRRAVETLEQVVQSDSANIRLKHELMLDYGAEADVLASFLIISNLNSLSEALPLRQKQLELAQELNAQQPQNPEIQRGFAQAQNLMGDQLLLAGQRIEASHYYSGALPLLENLATGSTNTKLLLELHDTYYRQLPVEVAAEELVLAIKRGRRALAIAQQISNADAQNTQALLILAADLSNLADVLSRAGYKREALEANAKALNIDVELARRFPKAAEFRHMRPSRFLTSGDIYFRLGEYQKALRAYGQSIEILKGMKAEDPANKWTNLRLAMAFNGVGAALDRTRDFTGGAKAYREALHLMSLEISGQQPSEDALYGSADAASGLAEIELSLGSDAQSEQSRVAHLRQALSWYDVSIKTWHRVHEPGLVSPTGFNCTPLTTVTARRSRCVAELASAGAAKSPHQEASRRELH